MRGLRRECHGIPNRSLTRRIWNELRTPEVICTPLCEQDGTGCSFEWLGRVQC